MSADDRTDTAKTGASLPTYAMRLTQQEGQDLLAWMNDHGYVQQWYEGLGDWRHRTRLISYAYSQIAEIATVGHALPRSAAECEQRMQDLHGSHCANPSEHPEP